MESLGAIKEKICETIDKNKDEFIALGHSILREPEVAFTEFKTAQKVEKAFSSLGLDCNCGQAVTGITAELLYDGAKNAKTVKKNFKPVMTKEEYLSKWCGINE